MAHLFKPQIVCYVDAEGRRVPKGTKGAQKTTTEARKWYAKGPPLPKGKKVPLASDKRAALQMQAELERKIERGETPIGGSEVEAAKRPLVEHLADFEADLKAAGHGTEHIRKKVAQIRRILTACAMERTADLDASKVQRFLAELQERGRSLPPLDKRKATYTSGELAAVLGITPGALSSLVARHRLDATGSGKARRFPRETAEALRQRLSRPPGIQTANHYLAAIRSFMRWLVDRGRLPRNPLAKLKAGNAKAGLLHDRRTLPLAELVKLFQATAQSLRSFRGLTGLDRLTFYLTACGTGFRAGELAVLNPESFTLDGETPTVALPAREDKAGRSVTQPLPAQQTTRTFRASLTADFDWSNKREDALFFGGAGSDDAIHEGVQLGGQRSVEAVPVVFALLRDLRHLPGDVSVSLYIGNLRGRRTTPHPLPKKVVDDWAHKVGCRAISGGDNSTTSPATDARTAVNRRRFSVGRLLTRR